MPVVVFDHIVKYNGKFYSAGEKVTIKIYEEGKMLKSGAVKVAEEVKPEPEPEIEKKSRTKTAKSKKVKR